MRKIIVVFLTAVMLMSMCVPVFAYQYGFETGADTVPDFGNSTSINEPVSPDPISRNIRRNKDAAHFPPPYFYGSGDIPTDTSSPYHNNLPGGITGYYRNTDNSTGSIGGTGDLNPSAYGGMEPDNISTTLSGSSSVSDSMSGASPNTVNLPDGLMTPTSTFTGTGSASNNESKYYEDGSIGTLYIEKLDKTLTVYEGESLENMQNGIGHFTETSLWNGNCVFAGHNRGADAYFGFVKDMAVGDKITYTTLYGTRTYEVYNKEQISDTDYTALGWSAENIISMITCVANEPALRYLVQAKEV